MILISSCTPFQCLGESLSNSTTVEELGAEPGQSLSLVIQLVSGAPHSEGITPTNQDEAPPTAAVMEEGGYRMPDVFTVEVISGEGGDKGQTKEVLVKVWRRTTVWDECNSI